MRGPDAGGMSRRDFLASLLKLGALGFLGVLGAKAVKGAVDGRPLTDTCAYRAPRCSSCGTVASCGHPTALSFKDRARIPAGGELPRS